MRLDMLLQILRSFESLSAEIALMRLQRDMDANMRRDVVALHRRCPAVAPLASEIQVVGALSAYMPLTNVILEIIVSESLYIMLIKRKEISVDLGNEESRNLAAAPTGNHVTFESMRLRRWGSPIVMVDEV